MGKKILYVEDEIELAELVTSEFNSKDYSYIHSIKLVEAVTKAKNQKFDAIVTDIKLAAGSGDQLIKAIKCNPQHMNYSTPIIVSSAFLTADVLKTINGKVDKVIVKPHMIEDLIKAIVEVTN